MKQPYRTAADRPARGGAAEAPRGLGVVLLAVWLGSVIRCAVAWREGDVWDFEPVLAAALAIGLAPGVARAAWRALGRDVAGRPR